MNSARIKKQMVMSCRTVLYGVVLLLFFGCSADRSSKSYSFYYWKSKAVYNAAIQKVLTENSDVKIYLHYFDIDKTEPENGSDDGIYPLYVLKSVADEYKTMEIVPVVFITNRVFKSDNLDVEILSGKIAHLIDQISKKHFGKEINRIQIDCDWTQTTRASYFSLLEKLQNRFKVEVTIRLHQIKFKDKTGIPPVDEGTLMLYNVGNLKNKQQNSILESNIVKQYVDEGTNYPMNLHVALPLFSQTIITNNQENIKIIKNAVRNELENDNHFKRMDENNYVVVQDTLYKGFYLSKGYNLKVEEIKESEIVKSYKIIEKSQLLIDEVIFYHLDETSLLSVDLNEIMHEL